MALILAIEPDRRQAGQLTAMVRGRLHAELVLGESAERALEALGDRVPDLVLTTALLSPKDEAALGERLRALNGVAAHVQTLTIPVLATSSKSRHNRGGMLSALRRDKGKPIAADGCDPAVFAEQVQEYLQHAEEEREAHAERHFDGADRDVEITTATIEAGPDVVFEPAAPEPIDEPIAEVSAEVIADAVDEPAIAVSYAHPFAPRQAFAAPIVESTPIVDEPVIEAPPVVETVEPPPPAPPPAPKRFRFSDMPATLMAAVAELEAHEAETIGPVETLRPETFFAPPEPEVVYAEPEEEAPVVAAAESDTDDTASEDAGDLDLSSLLDDETGSSRQPQAAAVEDEEPAVYELDGSAFDFSDFNDFSAREFTIEPLPRALTHPTPPPAPPEMPSFEPVIDVRAPEPVFEVHTPEPVFDEPLPTLSASELYTPTSTPASNPPDDLADWFDIIEALRRDAETVKFAPGATVAESELAIPESIAPAPAPEPHVEPTTIEAAPEPTPTPTAVDDAEQIENADSEAADTTSSQTVAAPSSNDPLAQARRKRKRTKGSPVQDEWGFFDPEQCGFAALIEKLEEIIDDDTPAPRRA